MRKVVFLVILFFSYRVLAQKVAVALDKLYKEYPQEKVILSLSKNDYLAGETIFFKAYILNGYEPSVISGNLYVELYDAKRNLVDKNILPVYKGSAEGSFILPPSLAEGVYFIRAYTHWMLNFDNAFEYLNPVKIFNPYSSLKIVPKPVQWDVGLFPESNILLSSIYTRVAVRLFATGSLPGSWHGELYEKSSSSPIAVVHPFNNNLGVFDFTPLQGGEYFVRITDNTGTSKELTLPQVQAEGIYFRMRNEGSKISYTIVFRKKSVSGAGYKILGTLNDEKILLAEIKKSGGSVSGSFNTEEFPRGVMQFTLFDENENPVVSRLVFVDPLHLPVQQPTLVTDSLSGEPKAINEWKLVQDSATWYTYAVQVQDANYPAPANFLGDLYLGSDFSSINDASWYFDKMDDEKASALDALLISEKWKRFSWGDLLQNRFPQIKFLPDQLLSFKASVKRKKRVEGLKDVNLVFQAKDSSIQIIQVPLDSAGNFYLRDMYFIDTLKVFFQLNSQRYAAKEISIDFQPLNTFSELKQLLPSVPYVLTARSVTDSLPSHIKWAQATRNNELLMNEKYKMMQEVIVKYKKKSLTQELDDKLSSGTFQSTDATIFDFINQDQGSAMGYINILTWLQGRVAGLLIRNTDGQITVEMRGRTPAIFVDEFRVEASYLNGLSASEIAMIKVIKGPFLGGGSTGSDGAIAIYTRRGDMNSRYSYTNPDLHSDYLAGYKKQPEFFMPDFINEETKNFSDQREIVYRKNLLVPDSLLKSTIRFYNNDITKSFRIIVTGFTKNGEPVFLDKVIEAKKEY